MTIIELWKAIKWSNLNHDGSVTISSERVKAIDKIVNSIEEEIKEGVK